jgi:hypothetical protein
MSELPLDYRTQLDLRDEIARIDRNRAESDKLRQETEKFIAEQRKLISESRKLDRERWWFPLLQLLTVSISSAAIGAIVNRLWH